MSAELRSTYDGSTMVLTIAGPEQPNTLSPAISAAGVEALNAAENKPEVRAVIITGQGAHFCAGGNLRQLQAERQQPAQAQVQSLESLHNWIETIRAFPKPVIAAVEGTAAGGGFALALACDLIVAARNARFVMSGSRFGLSPQGGGSWQLARGLPRQLAAELLLGGSPIDAQRLHQLGLVGRLSEVGQALPDALSWADQLGQCAPNVLSSLKELIEAAGDHSLHQHLQVEREHFVRNLHHPNAGLGLSAFLDKHSPRFE